MTKTFEWLGYRIDITCGAGRCVGTADDGSIPAPFIFVAPDLARLTMAIRVFIGDRTERMGRTR
jgi:hypothetical protein